MSREQNNMNDRGWAITGFLIHGMKDEIKLERRLKLTQHQKNSPQQREPFQLASRTKNYEGAALKFGWKIGESVSYERRINLY